MTLPPPSGFNLPYGVTLRDIDGATCPLCGDPTWKEGELCDECELAKQPEEDDE